MKTVKFILAFLFCASLTAQEEIWDVTYFDLPADKIGEFVQDHKNFMNITMNEDRKVISQWVYRHWYGSGPIVVVYTSFASAEDAVNDDPWGAFRQAWQSAAPDGWNANSSKSNERQKRLEALGQRYAGYLADHTDEIRSYNTENFAGKPDVDWDTNFVFVVGNYNTKSANWNKLGQAFMNWQTKPGVEKGLQLGGGYSVHFSGSGYDVQVFQGFANIRDFAKAISSENVADSQYAPDFWAEVAGDHEDQIYLHVGHLVDGKFDLAGPDKE